jgi:hypothetical protein
LLFETWPQARHTERDKDGLESQVDGRRPDISRVPVEQTGTNWVINYPEPVKSRNDQGNRGRGPGDLWDFPPFATFGYLKYEIPLGI